MSLALENINLVKQRTRWDTRKPGVSEVLRALWKHMEALGNPDLQLVPFDQTTNADTVIADVACKLYALFFKKPATSTVDAWFKGSNHATVAAAAGDIVIPLVGSGGGGAEHCLCFPDGLKLSTGLTIAEHTSLAGSTDSNDADAVGGWAIVGAA
jgi:hypothetical protein